MANTSKGKYRIDPDTIQRVLDRAQIFDVVSDFVTLHKKGVSYVGLCPFHEDRHPSFYVTPSKNICKCFACGEGGSPLNFVMKHEQMTYIEAIRYLAQKYGIEIVERELSDDELQKRNERESLLNANAFAKDAYHKALMTHEEGRLVGLPYFKERGLNEKTIETFQLGYALEDPHFLENRAREKGIPLKNFIELGLVSKDQESGRTWERFRSRIMFPIYTLSGSVVGFGGRILKADQKGGKYVNSPDSLVYNKSELVYGLFQAKQSIAKLDKCYIVEGYMDVLAMHQAGFTNVVASSGTALTEGQIRSIRRFSTHVTLFFDGDAAGIKAALRGVDLVLRLGLSVKVLVLPTEHDPDSFVKSRGKDEVEAYIDANEQDFLRFKIDVLSRDIGDGDIQGRKEMIDSVLDSVAVIADPLARQLYIQEVSQLLDISEDLAIESIDAKRRVAKEEWIKQQEIKRRQEEREQKLDEQDFNSSVQLSSTPTNPVTSKPQKVKEQLKSGEYPLLYFLVRHAFLPLTDVQVACEDGAYRSMFAHEFIYDELSELSSNKNFFSLLFRRFLDLYREEMLPLGDITLINNRLLSLDDDDLRNLSTQLITNERPLSKIHFINIDEEEENKKLYNTVGKLTLTLKFNYADETIKSLMKTLKTEQDENKRLTLMHEVQNWSSLRNQMAKAFGDRVLLPKNFIK